MKRKIIKIDREKCTGCGECIPNCPEGALQIIDDKACLVSDLFCDGLGACIGHCPEGAISVEMREAEKYDEKKVMKNIIKQGENVINAHLKHLKEHKQDEYFREAINFLKEKGMKIPAFEEERSENKFSGCPGSKVINFESQLSADSAIREKRDKTVSQLGNWPVQIKLVPVNAPYFKNANLLVAADCVPFAYADFHKDVLKGKVLLIGCPKLDDIEFYKEKFIQIFKNNNIKSITCLHMQVPCCFGLIQIIREAVSDSEKNIPIKEVTISIKGEVLE